MKPYLKLLLLFLPVMAGAQQKYTDSLKNALAMAKTDSARYATLGDLTYYYVQVDVKTAIKYVNQRLQITRRNKDHELDESATLIMKGFILLFSDQYTESLSSLEQALRIAQDPKNTGKAWKREGYPDPEKARIDIIANVHLSWGHLMGATGDINTQMAQYKLTIKYAQQAGDTGLVAWGEQGLGWCYLSIDKLDSALQMAERAEPIIEKNYKQLFGRVGIKKYLSEEDVLLGEIYMAKKDTAPALHYYREGVRDGIAQVDYSHLINSYDDLSDYFLSVKQADSSIKYTKKALETLRKQGSNDVADEDKDLYYAYKLKHMTDSAYKYEDSAMNAQSSKYSTTQQNLSNFQKQSFHEQISLRDEEKARVAAQTRNRIYLLFAGIGLLILLTLIFFRNFRRTQAANDLLQRQKEEIQNTLAQLKSTQLQLIQREKLVSLGELTAGIAHEIQNPLNFVNNFSEVNIEMLGELDGEIKNGNLSEIKAIVLDIKENEQKINQHGKRAESIVKGMLQHSRASSGERQETDINALADEFLKLSYHGLRAKDKEINVDIQTNFDRRLPNIPVIRQDFGRVLLNLFNNAFYAVQQKQKTTGSYSPVVEISTAHYDDHIEILVRDNGIGIPEIIRNKIMQPFFTTKPTGQGTGLGLSISYDIVTGHGGRIEFDSIEGEKTEFRIVLPYV